MRNVGFVSKIINLASSVCLNLGAFLIGFALVSVCYGVLMRYVLHLPSGWVLGVNEYTTGAIVFLGLSYVQRQRGHVRVDLVVRRLPQKAEQILAVCGSIAGVVYIATLTWRSWFMAYSSFRHGIMTLGIVSFPLYWPQLIFTFGLALFVLQLIRSVIIDARTLLTK